MNDKVTVKMNLSIGTQEDKVVYIEYDKSEIPTDPDEQQDFLNDEWWNWSSRYIEGNAVIVWK